MEMRRRIPTVLFGVALLVAWMARAAPAAPKEKKAKEAPSKGKVQSICTFDDPAWEEHAHADGVKLKRVKRGDEYALQIQVPRGSEQPRVILDPTPADIRTFRSIRFWIRGSGNMRPVPYLRLVNPDAWYMDTRLTGVTGTWQRMEIRLGDMRLSRGFDPENVEGVSFSWFESQSCTLEVDNVELVGGEGGWRLSDEEVCVRFFGKARAKKAKKQKTKHFTIWSDTKAARKRFPKELEKTYERIRAWLDLEEMKTPLPVFVFQNPELYWDFCARHLSWSRQEAQESAGHGSGDYFATYFQGNRTPTITHELTHAMFDRAVGWGGGSAFQEGVAVYCEDRDNKKSSAKLFSASLRGGRHVPLREFLTTEMLIGSKDKSGGARTADTLYAQAGAFFEFLLRSEWARANRSAELKKTIDPTGHLPPSVHARIVEIAKSRELGEDLIPVFERVFGASLEQTEKAWIAWGRKPPKPPKYR